MGIDSLVGAILLTVRQQIDGVLPRRFLQLFDQRSDAGVPLAIPHLPSATGADDGAATVTDVVSSTRNTRAIGSSNLFGVWHVVYQGKKPVNQHALPSAATPFNP